MKLLLIMTLLLTASLAQADMGLPSSIECLKDFRDLGLTRSQSWQVCSSREEMQSCVHEQITGNKSSGKSAIKFCLEKIGIEVG